MQTLIFVAGTLGLIAFILWSTHRTARLLRKMRIRENLLLNPAENGAKILLILSGFALGNLSGASMEALGWGAPGWTTLLLGAGAGLLLWLPLNAMTWLAIQFWGKEVYSPLVLRSIMPRTAGQWPLVLLALIPAALLEELLFRSLVLGGFGQWVSPLLLAVLASALFGASHVAQGRASMALTSGLGFGFSLLFLWTHSLAAVTAAHWTLNVLQMVAASAKREELERLYPEPQEESEQESPPGDGSGDYNTD